ncbi:cytochrome P450 [Suillus occidentalis]|nr:cytochrome P450 [Suillus occidentalis]
MHYLWLLVCAVGLFLYTVWSSYFARNPLDNIPGPLRQHWCTGNLNQIFAQYAWDFHKMLAERYGPVSKFYGLFGARELYVFDPKAMYHILAKDQDTFEVTPAFLATSKVLFGDGLLSTSGEHHRKQRKLLNPAFSISHVRNMVPAFLQVMNCLRDGIAAQVKHGPREINMLEWLNRTALELVGQSGLGYSFDCLKEGYVNPYSAAVKNLVPTILKVRFIVRIFPWKALKEVCGIVDDMDEASMKVFEEKKPALSAGDDAVLHQVGEGKDIMSILLRANMDASAEDRLPDSELVAQMSTLVFTATHTTAGALALNDIVLPFSRPIKGNDGTYMREVLVPKNTNVIVSILNSNRDPETWGDDALQCKPERWLSPLPQSVVDAEIPGVYSHLMTFIGGGRACIGFKFSELEMKIVLCKLVQTFRFTPTKEIDWTTQVSSPNVKGPEDAKWQLPPRAEMISDCCVQC